jgi:hypothetical protein
MQIILKYTTQFNDQLNIVVNKSSVDHYKHFDGKLMIHFKVKYPKKNKIYEWSFIQFEDKIANINDVNIFLKLNCKQL